MPNEKRPGRNDSGHRRRCTVAELCAIAALLLSASATAQYDLSDPAEDDKVPSIRYFGSAKDDKGALLQGVTIDISDKDSGFVFVTSDEGRFRANLPLSMTPEKMTVKCSRPGFRLVRVTMRPGPPGPKPTVQVDCVLRVAGAS